MEFLNFASYDADTWLTYLKDNWFIIAIVLVVLFLVVKIVKTVIKWAIVAVVVIGFVVYSGYSLDDVKELGGKVVDSVKQEALGVMMGEAEAAEYRDNDDGSYSVLTSNIELRGKSGSDEVKVSLRGAPAITFQMDPTIRSFIEQAKRKN